MRGVSHLCDRCSRQTPPDPTLMGDALRYYPTDAPPEGWCLVVTGGQNATAADVKHLCDRCTEDLERFMGATRTTP